MLNAIVVSIRFILLILGGQKQVALENAALRQQLAGFNESAARNLVGEYRATFEYAELDKAANMPSSEPQAGEEESPTPTTADSGTGRFAWAKALRSSTASAQKGHLMPGERELTAGLLSKGTNFRLIVSGHVGVKEIDRLIAKLQFDKEILAEQDDTEDANDE